LTASGSKISDEFWDTAGVVAMLQLLLFHETRVCTWSRRGWHFSEVLQNILIYCSRWQRI